MLKFLATTENQQLRSSEDSRYDCEKVDRNYKSKIAIRKVTRIFSTSRAVLFPTEFRKKCNRREGEKTLTGKVDS